MREYETSNSMEAANVAAKNAIGLLFGGGGRGEQAAEAAAGQIGWGLVTIHDPQTKFVRNISTSLQTNFV